VLLIIFIGYEAGRVRVIFELPRHLSYMYKGKLAYIEHFRPFSQCNPMPHRLYSTSHAMARGVRRTSVIPLSLIQMSCHLTPRYKQLDDTVRITPDTDLMSTFNQFFFNKYCSYFVFVVMEHWRQRVNCESPVIHFCRYQRLSVLRFSIEPAQTKRCSSPLHNRAPTGSRFFDYADII
jgi:hypothetical protein